MLKTILYILALVAAYAIAGWLLICFHAAPWIWLGSVCVIFYLAKSKTEAIAPASAWIVCLVAGITVSKTWPVSFSQHFPSMARWAGTLLLLWLFGLALVLLLAFSNHVFAARFSNRQTSMITTIASLAGLAIGLALNRHTP